VDTNSVNMLVDIFSHGITTALHVTSYAVPNIMWSIDSSFNGRSVREIDPVTVYTRI